MASNRYCIDLAKRGTAGCKECKLKIDKGLVRIAKVIPNHFSDSGGDMKQWFHVRCIFEKLSRARATTKKIDDIEDLEGWDDLDDEHKPEVIKCISEFSSGSSTKKTPQKKAAKKPDEKSPNKKEDSPDPDEEEPPPTKDDTLRQFRKICAQISDVSEYKQKSAILTKFFSKGSDGSGFKGNLYLWVKMLLPSAEKRVYNLQNKQLVKLFSEMFDADHDKMLSHFEENGQVAETIAEFFDESRSFPPNAKSTLYLQDIDKFLLELSRVGKEVEQSRILSKVAKKCTSNDLKMFIRFIKHDLRINAGPKHILEGVNPTAYDAFQASRNLKDIIERCIKQKKGGKNEEKLTVQACLMTPVLPMLAMVCGSPLEPFKRFKDGFYVEIKYDGERVQLHKKDDEFNYFSRSLKPVMAHKVSHLKNYIPKAFPHGNNLILDCEILLVGNDGVPLPFGSLGAHKKSAFKDACVCLFVFDCLQFNDENLMNEPLWKRRKILEKNMIPVENRVMFSEMKEITKISQLSRIIDSVIEQGLEGLVLKGKDTIYEPGKRHWLKLKKDYLKGGSMADTADLVVLGGYYGTGRKGGIISVFLMGSLNEKTGKWCTVTKVPGGDDKTLENLQKDLKMKKIGKDPANIPPWLNVNKHVIPDFVVENPKDSPVWVISGAEFSKAEVHTANGISIRFPRVSLMRDDKTWKEATTVQELQHIFEKSKHKSELIGLATEDSDDSGADDATSNTFVFNKASKTKLESSEEPVPKKLKKESSDSPTKSSIKHDESKRTPSKKTKNESCDTSSSKKLKLEPKETSENNEGSSSNELPDIFTGVKLYIPQSIENADVLRRYFLAFDGTLLSDLEMNDASHVIVPTQTSDNSHPKNAVKVTVDWFWDSIKLKEKCPIELYKVES